MSMTRFNIVLHELMLVAHQTQPNENKIFSLVERKQIEAATFSTYYFRNYCNYGGNIDLIMKCM